MAVCTDVMSLSPAPITCVCSLVIACGWHNQCQALRIQSHLVKESIMLVACNDKFPVMVAAHSSLLS